MEELERTVKPTISPTAYAFEPIRQRDRAVISLRVEEVMNLLIWGEERVYILYNTSSWSLILIGRKECDILVITAVQPFHRSQNFSQRVLEWMPKSSIIL